MLLIRCPECQKDIPASAKHCLKCGYPMAFLSPEIKEKMCRVVEKPEKTKRKKKS